MNMQIQIIILILVDFILFGTLKNVVNLFKYFQAIV